MLFLWPGKELNRNGSTVASMVIGQEKTGNPFYKQNSKDMVTDSIGVLREKD